MTTTNYTNQQIFWTPADLLVSFCVSLVVWVGFGVHRARFGDWLLQLSYTKPVMKAIRAYCFIFWIFNTNNSHTKHRPREISKDTQAFPREIFKDTQTFPREISKDTQAFPREISKDTQTFPREISKDTQTFSREKCEGFQGIFQRQT